MSLIIEALKRARDDAIRRQAAARGLPLAPVPRMRESRRWLSFAVVPLAAALVICVLLLIDLYSRLPDPEQTASAPAAAGTLAPPIAAAKAVPEPTEPAVTSPEAAQPVSGPPAPSVDRAVAPEVQGRPDPPPPRETTAFRDQAATDADRQPRATPVAAAPPPAPPTDVSQVDDVTPAREFVGQARLRDGQVVDLEGIAWSESEPFALLNGQVIGVGEFIRAYRVSDIQRDHVILEQDEDRVLLRLE